MHVALVTLALAALLQPTSPSTARRVAISPEQGRALAASLVLGNLAVALLARGLPADGPPAPRAFAGLASRGAVEWRVLGLASVLFACSLGYGGTTSFVALYCRERDVRPVGIWFTGFAVAVFALRCFCCASGSDAYSLRTRAERTQSGYVLNGSKTFVTNAPVADLAVVFATLDPAKGMWGITAFLIEMGTPGFRIGNRLEKMGLRTSPMAELFLEDCQVAESARLGPEGAGARIFNHSMEWERSCILGSHVGAMEHQLEEAIRYTRERRQFGQAIGKFQSVANRIADMKVKLETARLLLYKVAWLKKIGKPAVMEAAMAKHLYLSECFVQSSRHAAAGRLFGHSLLCLTLGANEQNNAAIRHSITDHIVSLVQQFDGLLQVNDVNAVTLREDVRLHAGLPLVGAMPEMDAALKQGLHRNYGHREQPPRVWPPTRIIPARDHVHSVRGTHWKVRERVK